MNIEDHPLIQAGEEIWAQRREQALSGTQFAFVRPTFEPEVLTSDEPADDPNPFADLDFEISDPPTFPKRVREKRVTIGFPNPEELEAAKAKAAVMEIPLAELVRRCLREVSAGRASAQAE